ncbi:hypothetical protein KCU83_g181, partial [Aureobasidium melanogenum]
MFSSQFLHVTTRKGLIHFFSVSLIEPHICLIVSAITFLEVVASVRKSLFCAWNTALLLLVVLPVHSCVGFVSSICGVWILSILLVVLGIGLSVVRCGSGSGTHGCSSGVSGCGRGSASITTSITSAIAAVSTAISTTSISASIAAVTITVAIATTVSTVAIVVATTTSASAAARAALLELLILGANIGQEIETELFGTLNLVGVRATIHGLITLVSGIVLHETRSTALNLDAASSLLLDMFDIGAALAYNLGTEVEARNGLEIHRNFLLWPFTLWNDLHDPWNLSRPALALYDGNVSRLRDLVGPASLALQSQLQPSRGHLWWCWSREGKGEGSKLSKPDEADLIHWKELTAAVAIALSG